MKDIQEINNDIFECRKIYKKYGLGVFGEDFYDDDIYIGRVLSITAPKEDIIEVFKQYKSEILEIIKDDDTLDEIMQLNGEIRHDIDFDENVDFEKITNDILGNNQELNYFESRTKFYIFYHIMDLINKYGIQNLKDNYIQISKKIRYSIAAKSKDVYYTRADFDTITEYGDKYGVDSIQYFMNRSLLIKRLKSLIEFSDNPDEIIKLQEILKSATEIENIESTEQALEQLKQAYADYENINRQMIISRLTPNIPDIINTPDKNSLLLLHFISEHTDSTDIIMDEHFEEYITDAIKKRIECELGKNLKPELYKEEFERLYTQYRQSLENPFDFNSRIVIPSYSYIHGKKAILKPSSILSTSLTNIGNIFPHLDRKLAIGFTSETISQDSITSIAYGYNQLVDRWSFDADSVALSELFYFAAIGCTQETLIDWTKVKPAYILIIKDEEKISEDLLSLAQKYHEMTGLPLKIYDKYEMQKNMPPPEKNDGHFKPIMGAFSASDIPFFARLTTSDETIKWLAEYKAAIEKSIQNDIVQEGEEK